MQYALDLAVLVLMILFIVVGAKRGFVKSFSNFFGALFAMIGASILSGPAATWLYNTLFRNALEEKIATAVSGLGTADAVTAVFSDFPELIQRALKAAGITQGSVMAQLQGGADSVAKGITDALSPMLTGLLRVLTLLVLFLILLLILRALTLFLTGVFQLPVLHQVNGLLGAVFGAMMTVLVLWVVLAGVRAYLPMLSDEMQVRTETAFEESYAAGILYEYNPVYVLIS